MPLPTDPKMEWPPDSALQREYQEHAAWYSGDPTRLADYYSDIRDGSNVTGSSVKRRRFQFWSQNASAPERRLRLHLPLPGDIATASADLLFSERPTITYAEVSEVEGEDTNAPTDEEAEALQAMLDENAIGSVLLEGAEVASALSGVYLRIVHDTSVSDWPIITVMHPDRAVPEWRFGRLQAVTFWTIVMRDDDYVFRHLERHSRGTIEHALYRGSVSEIGSRVPLNEVASLQSLIPLLEDGDVIRTVPDRMTAVYIPNIRPNRRHRGSPLGRSDFDSIEGLFDALDETWTSLMRDIRLGRSRILVPDEFLRDLGPGKGSYFDVDQEVFVPLRWGPSGDVDQIVPQQFDIRVQEHLQTATALMSQAIATAGYSGRTFGLHDEGGAATATEVHAAERRSFITRGKKEAYWRPAVAYLIETAIEYANALMSKNLRTGPIAVELGDSVREPVSVVAQSLQMLEAARAASSEVKVRMLHPDWDEVQVQAEVERLESSAGPVMGGDPSGGLLDLP